jgi:hypothetical protein
MDSKPATASNVSHRPPVEDGSNGTAGNHEPFFISGASLPDSSPASSQQAVPKATTYTTALPSSDTATPDGKESGSGGSGSRPSSGKANPNGVRGPADDTDHLQSPARTRQVKSAAPAVAGRPSSADRITRTASIDEPRTENQAGGSSPVPAPFIISGRSFVLPERPTTAGGVAVDLTEGTGIEAGPVTAWQDNGHSTTTEAFVHVSPANSSSSPGPRTSSAGSQRVGHSHHDPYEPVVHT